MSLPNKKNASGELYKLDYFGKDWEKLARLEIQRRKEGGKVNDPNVVNLPAVPGGDEPDLISDAVQVQNRPLSHQDQFFPSYAAVEDLLDLFLKEFIIRTNKTARFLEWTQEFCREIVRRGKCVSNPIDSEQNYHYQEFTFSFIWNRERSMAELTEIRRGHIG